MNCHDFKTGIFYYKSNQTGKSYFITRNDSIQLERDIATGSIMKAQIKWVSDCEYQLNYLGMEVLNNDTIADYLKTHTLTTKILKTKIGEVSGTKFNYCVFESILPGVKQKVVDTLWKRDSAN